MRWGLGAQSPRRRGSVSLTDLLFFGIVVGHVSTLPLQIGPYCTREGCTGAPMQWNKRRCQVSAHPPGQDRAGGVCPSKLTLTNSAQGWASAPKGAGVSGWHSVKLWEGLSEWTPQDGLAWVKQMVLGPSSPQQLCTQGEAPLGHC